MSKTYVLGIDFALSAQKRMPAKLMCIQNGEMQVLPLPILPPYGPGLKAIFDDNLYLNYKQVIMQWLQQIVESIGQQLDCIAIDCPTQYCKPNHTMRPSEKAVRAMGCGIFKTPTYEAMNVKLAEARKQFEMTKKMKGGFSVWMKQAVDFADWCHSFCAQVIEVFPGLYWKINKLDKAVDSQSLLIDRMNHLQSLSHLHVLWNINERFLDDEIDALYCACTAAAFVANKSVVSLGDKDDFIYLLASK